MKKKLTFDPAMDLVGSLGLTTPLGAAFIYDGCIQMGCDSKLYQTVAGQFAAQHQGRTLPPRLPKRRMAATLYSGA